MPNIQVQSSDGEVFVVDVEVAKCLGTIKHIFEDLGLEENDDVIVPLPNVNSVMLRKILDWATYHQNDPPPSEDHENNEKRSDDINSWDAEFLKLDVGSLAELTLAANYLDIKGLLEVSGKVVANTIKGKTSEEIRRMVNIKNNITPAK